MAQSFDPVAFKETTRKQWQNAAAAWYRWTPTLQAWLGPVTEAMLDMADLQPGDRVLDLAAGAGEPSLSAAEKVGPGGHVLATDISSNILEFAALTARDRGLNNFETRVMDGERPDAPDSSFDAVLSRLGLIYFPDRVGAVREARRVLKSGGGSCWRALQRRITIGSFQSPSQSSAAGRNWVRRHRARLGRSASARQAPWRTCSA